MSRKSRGKYYFNPETMVYEKRRLSFRERYDQIIEVMVAVLVMSALIFFLTFSVFEIELPKTALLRNRSANWHSKMEILENRLNRYEDILRVIEDRDNDVYRSIFGMGNIGFDERILFDETGSAQLDSANRHIMSMSRRAYTQSKSLDDVSRQVQNVGDLVSHIPAVPPLCPEAGKVRISSSFGVRTDPVYGGTEYHQGQDFAAPKGYPVYATGAGVVKYVKHQFYGYGNEIVIDHGFGYCTRYAHLSIIHVTDGMEVKRGDQIGEVGSTGKSTGSHLHYEVEYMGRRVNPMNYMDYSMDIPEFKSMVEKRKAEKREAQHISTSDILKRTRH